MLWNLLLGNGTEIGMYIVFAGVLIEAMRRFHNAQMTAIESSKDDILKIVSAVSERLVRVEEQQRENSDRLRRLEEGQLRLEEERKEDSERL